MTKITRGPVAGVPAEHQANTAKGKDNFKKLMDMWSQMSQTVVNTYRARKDTFDPGPLAGGKAKVGAKDK